MVVSKNIDHFKSTCEVTHRSIFVGLRMLISVYLSECKCFLVTCSCNLTFYRQVSDNSSQKKQETTTLPLFCPSGGWVIQWAGRLTYISWWDNDIFYELSGVLVTFQRNSDRYDWWGYPSAMVTSFVLFLDWSGIPYVVISAMSNVVQQVRLFRSIECFVSISVNENIFRKYVQT